MNKNLQTLFTTQEFARLCNVSKHTLFHYDETGVFHPEYRDTNGYRYYSVAQLEVFHVISVLKELEMPLRDIKDYLSRRSPRELVRLLEEKETLLLDKVHRLLRMQRLIHEKAQLTRRACRIKENMVLIRRMPREMLVTTPVRLRGEKDLAIAIAQHVRYCEDNGVVSPYSIGSIQDRQRLLRGETEAYTYFYTKVETRPDSLPVFIKEEGRCIVSYHLGGYESLPKSYGRMFAFARRNRLTLQGDFFEDILLDELSVKGEDQYCLRLSIRVDEKEDGALEAGSGAARQAGGREG